MKISLNNFIKEYYNKLDFIGTSYNKNKKAYLQFEYKNKQQIEEVLKKYNNIDVVYTTSEYVPELKKIFITLKTKEV